MDDDLNDLLQSPERLSMFDDDLNHLLDPDDMRFVTPVKKMETPNDTRINGNERMCNTRIGQDQNLATAFGEAIAWFEPAGAN